MMGNLQLKCCPYCNGEAYIKYIFGYAYIDAFHSKKCKMKPNTWLLANYSLKKQAKAWNMRPKNQGGA